MNPEMSSAKPQRRSGAAVRTVRAALAAYAQQDYARAVRQLAPVAAAGDPDAPYQLGPLYARGHGVIISPIDAVAWYRRAAEQGHAKAQ